jgi:hypothetical protein
MRSLVAVDRMLGLSGGGHHLNEHNPRKPTISRRASARLQGEGEPPPCANHSPSITRARFAAADRHEEI